MAGLSSVFAPAAMPVTDMRAFLANGARLAGCKACHPV